MPRQLAAGYLTGIVAGGQQITGILEQLLCDSVSWCLKGNMLHPGFAALRANILAVFKPDAA